MLSRYRLMIGIIATILLIGTAAACAPHPVAIVEKVGGPEVACRESRRTDPTGVDARWAVRHSKNATNQELETYIAAMGLKGEVSANDLREFYEWIADNCY